MCTFKLQSARAIVRAPAKTTTKKFYITVWKWQVKHLKELSVMFLFHSFFCRTLWRGFPTTPVIQSPNWLAKKYGGSMTRLPVRYTQWFTARTQTYSRDMHINKLVYYLYYAVYKCVYHRYKHQLQSRERESQTEREDLLSFNTSAETGRGAGA